MCPATTAFSSLKIYHLISPSSKNSPGSSPSDTQHVCIYALVNAAREFSIFTIWTIVLCLHSYHDKNPRCITNIYLPEHKHISGQIFISPRAKNLILSRLNISKFLCAIAFSISCEKQPKKLETHKHTKGRKRSGRTWSFSSFCFFLSKWKLIHLVAYLYLLQTE